MVLTQRHAASPSVDALPPVHGADGRLVHYHGLPFEHQRNLLIQKTSVTLQ